LPHFYRTWIAGARSWITATRQGETGCLSGMRM
jgi:hypothetical protein